jgi:uncharacterized Zn finger protein (UPF0148 family)
MIRGLEWYPLCVRHEKTCPACGTEVDRNMIYCPNCVARLVWEEHDAKSCQANECIEPSTNINFANERRIQ